MNDFIISIFALHSQCFLSELANVFFSSFFFVASTDFFISIESAMRENSSELNLNTKCELRGNDKKKEFFYFDSNVKEIKNKAFMRQCQCRIR